MNGRVYLIFWLLAALAFVGLFLWVGKLPPDHIRMAAGGTGSAYDAAAQQIKTILARSGVTVDLVQTQGTDDRLKRLTSTGKDAIDVAIVRSGNSDAQGTAGIANLGALFIEPVWLFGRRLPLGFDIRRLVGMKLGVGRGSAAGSNALFNMLLSENGLTPKDFTLVPLAMKDVPQALLDRKIDAAWIVGGIQSDWIQTLLASPELELVSFDRAAAYARRHSFLVDTVLSQGVIDLGRNIPGHDIKLVGPTAQLIVRDSLHPALQSLLLDAIHEIFTEGDAISAPGMYPNQHLIDIPLSEEARRYYTSGPSFFRRVLPYWAANFAERALIFMIPLITLLLPLAQMAPPLYDWRIKRRIQAWYRQLRLVETQGLAARSVAELTQIRERLEKMVGEVGLLKVPLSYADDVYRLRAHIRFVTEFLNAQAKSLH